MWYSSSTFGWITVAFVASQLSILYWLLETDQWDYFLTRTNVAVPPPSHDPSLLIETSGAVPGSGHVSSGGTSVLMTITQDGDSAYLFVAPTSVEIAGQTGTRFLLLFQPKDRTRMRMSLMQHIHGATGGTFGMSCSVVWYSFAPSQSVRPAGLVDWCSVDDKSLYMINADGDPSLPSHPTRHHVFYALFGNTELLPDTLPGNIDVDAYASWFITQEMARDVNHLCINTVFERRDDKTYMLGTFDADNALGTRYDRGVAMADDGFFNTLLRFSHCPDWRHLTQNPVIAEAIRTKWQAARSGELSDGRLDEIITNFVAVHGVQARQMHAMYTDGKGLQKYSAMYNTFLSDWVTERNVHSYPGGYMTRVPRTYDGHVSDLRNYLRARTSWMDAHITNLETPPSPGFLHPAFVIFCVISFSYITFFGVVALYGLYRATIYRPAWNAQGTREPFIAF